MCNIYIDVTVTILFLYNWCNHVYVCTCVYCLILQNFAIVNEQKNFLKVNVRILAKCVNFKTSAGNDLIVEWSSS